MIGACCAVLAFPSAGFWASNGAAALLKYKMAIVRIKQIFPGTNAPHAKRFRSAREHSIVRKTRVANKNATPSKNWCRKRHHIGILYH
jgi:hypothetical protein